MVLNHGSDQIFHLLARLVDEDQHWLRARPSAQSAHALSASRSGHGGSCSANLPGRWRLDSTTWSLFHSFFLKITIDHASFGENSLFLSIYF